MPINNDNPLNHILFLRNTFYIRNYTHFSIRNPVYKKLALKFRNESLLFSCKGRFIIYGLGAGNNENCHNSRKSPYFRLIFTQHIIWPLRNLKQSTCKKISPPLNDVSKFSRPPLLKTKKIMRPKHLKNKKKCLLRTCGKNDKIQNV